MKINNLIKASFVFLLVLLICCTNSLKTTNKGTNKTNENDSVILIEEVTITENIDDFFINESIFFAGLVGNDSVFIESEPCDDEWRWHLTVYLGDNVIYKQPNDRQAFFINNSDVKIISLENKNIAYLLITKHAPIEGEKCCVLKVHNKQVTDTFEVFINILKDIDNDGFFEIGGRILSETPCNNIPCDSLYYIPYEIYKLKETFEFDSINSKKLTLMLYDTFLGFESSYDTVLHYSREGLNNILKIIK